MELRYPTSVFDRIFSKVIGYCGHCNNAVFNPNSKWARKGYCIYCWEIEEKLKKEQEE